MWLAERLDARGAAMFQHVETRRAGTADAAVGHQNHPFAVFDHLTAPINCWDG